MSETLDFNPALPESRQFTPPAEGGNGNIHKPGDYTWFGSFKSVENIGPRLCVCHR